MSFTKRQIELIEFCKEAGWGWRKFAESVEQSGKCTPKQEDTLCIMHQKINFAKAVKAGHFKSYGPPGINECDIMSFGLYI